MNTLPPDVQELGDLMHPDEVVRHDPKVERQIGSRSSEFLIARFVARRQRLAHDYGTYRAPDRPTEGYEDRVTPARRRTADVTPAARHAA